MKYIIHPGYIISPRDGDEHFIDDRTIMELFKVPPMKCDTRDYRNPRTFQHKSLIKGDVILRPQRDGIYDITLRGRVIQEDEIRPLIYRFWLHNLNRPKPKPKPKLMSYEEMQKVLEQYEKDKKIDPISMAFLVHNRPFEITRINNTAKKAAQINRDEKMIKFFEEWEKKECQIRLKSH